MKILVDMDSVLNDLVPEWLARYNRDYNDTLCEADLTEWDTWKFTKSECGKRIYTYLEDPTLFSILKPTEHSQEVIAGWCLRRHHEVYIVSAATHKTMEAKVDWLQKYYRTVGLDNIIFATHKYMVRGDLLIDDGPHNITAFPGNTILYSKPWNQELQSNLGIINAIRSGSNSIRVAHNWLEIEEILERWFD